MVVERQQPPSVFHNSSAIARYDLYVLTLTLRSSKAEMVTFFETKKITLVQRGGNKQTILVGE
ncbi:hypothetical protein [Nostoc sp. 'Peltigera membranacea cyanobiont' 210A]|uniref:hypothetical protein n=1 Tax=Nostoc sp. 'Peltigera membranacea cyanobiont' 210A TaxID=2014529 RepID=UPI00117D47E2|nr:hypothetical protein [Nostoc sp. 'Peltigera membranacea cyanobiont' 210A]